MLVGVTGSVLQIFSSWSVLSSFVKYNAIVMSSSKGNNILSKSIEITQN